MKKKYDVIQILCETGKSIRDLVVTTYKKADTEYRIKQKEEQTKIANSWIPVIKTEFYQFLTSYPVPTQYNLDLRHNWLMVEYLAGTRYEVQVPLTDRTKYDFFYCKRQLKPHLLQNLSDFHFELYAKQSLGQTLPFLIMQNLQIADVYQPEEGYIRIVVELRGC